MTMLRDLKKKLKVCLQESPLFVDYRSVAMRANASAILTGQARTAVSMTLFQNLSPREKRRSTRVSWQEESCLKLARSPSHIIANQIKEMQNPKNILCMCGRKGFL